MSEKTILEKLQFRPGRSISIINAPAEYLEKAGIPPENSEIFTRETPAVIIQVFVRSKVELEDFLPKLRQLVLPGGMAWISYPKLTSKLKGDINRDSINQISQTYGWTGIAMISIDEDWSALRLKPL